MKIYGLDHFVLTVASVENTVNFYRDILGFEEVTFGGGRKAVKAGLQKINLHQVRSEIAPHAKNPTPGSGDICVVYEESLDVIIAHLTVFGIDIEEGPVNRTGAMGPIRSIYIRDPDANLVELSVYLNDTTEGSVAKNGGLNSGYIN